MALKDDAKKAWELLLPLWDDADSDSEREGALILAHYTSLDTVQKIVQNNELWLSNPLLMNDSQEMMWGLDTTRRILSEGAGRLFGDKASQILLGWDAQAEAFENESMDVYVACFSEHISSHDDGLLSMWRGYGGNGAGAALIFDASRVELLDDDTFTFARVSYGSDEQRVQYITGKVQAFGKLASKSGLGAAGMFSLGAYFFERIVMMSIYSKHSGFEEEREWRLVYQSRRDIDGKHKKKYHCAITAAGVQPKLRLPLSSESDVALGSLALEDVLSKILLGPTVSSALSKRAMVRMLELAGREELSNRVFTSRIPYRA